ncbi:MAG: FxLYD domain-containing protein [Candidatus Portnoybacteria bacterium]|nr:FxLYD domain-containing protein [Candidatus Portnoybacteria bacterium]
MKLVIGLFYFMDYRRRKQTIIISILAAFFLVVGAWVYFGYFYQGASCFDGKQNQNETGIDCGGVCISCERLTAQDVKISWVRFFSLENNRYDLAAEISNPNSNFGLGKLNYNFQLKGEDGQTISKSGSAFILPGQTKYLVEANFDAGQKIKSISLVLPSIDKNDWQELKSDYDPRTVTLYAKDRQFQYLESGAAIAQATGVIKNESSFDFDRVMVSVVLFDADKQVIGVNKTEASTIPSGSERYFSVLWFEPLPGEVKSLDMLAETNLFADDNFMSQYGETEQFQQY